MSKTEIIYNEFGLPVNDPEDARRFELLQRREPAVYDQYCKAFVPVKGLLEAIMLVASDISLLEVDNDILSCARKVLENEAVARLENQDLESLRMIELGALYHYYSHYYEYYMNIGANIILDEMFPSGVGGLQVVNQIDSKNADTDTDVNEEMIDLLLSGLEKNMLAVHMAVNIHVPLAMMRIKLDGTVCYGIQGPGSCATLLLPDGMVPKPFEEFIDSADLGDDYTSE